MRRRRSSLYPRAALRATETTVDQQLIDSGASGAYGYDPIDGDFGWQSMGGQLGSRPVPGFTLERARAQSVSAYRSNPMGRAIIDTYTAFCVGDTGVRPESSDPAVHRVLTDFWDDPLVDLGAIQERLLRSHMLYGEVCSRRSRVICSAPCGSSRLMRRRLLA
jgi:hypothetical protein